MTRRAVSYLEAAFPLGYVLLRVKEDDINLGHVEHPQRHRGRQAEGDGQGGGLDVHLGDTEREVGRGRERLIYHIWTRQRRLCATGPSGMCLVRTDQQGWN